MLPFPVYDGPTDERLGREREEARPAYERALALAQQEPERRFLRMRLEQL